LKNKRTDPLILKLNVGSDYSLLKNPGKHTLIVATFTGKSMTALNTRSFKNKFENFKVGTSLDDAAKQAWQLATHLRKTANVEAWVYHDRHQSVVTVGAFNSENDPRIRSTAFRYRAKNKQHPQTGRKILTGEIITIPRNPRPGQKIEKYWIFDPKPRLMEVPKFGR
jgi:hypothetical protein